MSASRLKGKPLLLINNLPIICHVVNKAKESNIGEVIVATEDEEILSIVEKNNGKGILTGKHNTGTDRVFEAYQKLKIDNVEYILNLQGDEPMIDPKDIINLNNLMIKNNSDLGTLASEIKDEKMFDDKNVVKVSTKNKLKNNNFIKALDFSRKYSLNKNLNIYHHIGIYCYKISILKKIVNLDQSKDEIKNNLEQLRAISNGIEISVALAKKSSIGVDTEEDYVAIKKIMEYKS